MIAHEIVAAFHNLYYGSFVWDKGTTWLGIPVQQCPMDLWAMQEIVFRVRPDLIVETGTGRGGSTLFLAQICDALSRGTVMSIDSASDRRRPEHERITYLLGSSTAVDVVDTIAGLAHGAEAVMVILDSDHQKDHVAKELACYSPFVTPGSYIIVEATNIDGRPIKHRYGPGPGIAADEFLALHPEFEVDKSMEKFLMTQNPGGYLRRRA